jgi:hypothetical protein
MGFNKRIINKEKLIQRFKLKGYQGVIDYIGDSDALIGMDDELNKILEISYCNTCTTNKNIRIQKIIDGK